MLCMEVSLGAFTIWWARNVKETLTHMGFLDYEEWYICRYSHNICIFSYLECSGKLQDSNSFCWMQMKTKLEQISLLSHCVCPYILGRSALSPGFGRVPYVVGDLWGPVAHSLPNH